MWKQIYAELNMNFTAQKMLLPISRIFLLSFTIKMTLFSIIITSHRFHCYWNIYPLKRLFCLFCFNQIHIKFNSSFNIGASFKFFLQMNCEINLFCKVRGSIFTYSCIFNNISLLLHLCSKNKKECKLYPEKLSLSLSWEMRDNIYHWKHRLKSTAICDTCILVHSWSSSHIRWGQDFRLRHLSTGHYLALTEDRGLVLQDREKSDTAATAFCFRPSKVRP